MIVFLTSHQPVLLLLMYSVSLFPLLHVYCISLPLDPPLVSPITPTNIASPRTTTVNITCVYDGNPDPVVSWYRGSLLLVDAFDDVTITTTSTESTLTLSNIQPDDGGIYYCITNNVIGPGNVAGSTTLLVQGKINVLRID